MIVFRTGCRPSPLAKIQVRQLQQHFSRVSFEIVSIFTDGDLDKSSSLANLEGSDFFTRQIDQALLSNKIDIAVHSAKDLPEELPRGLAVAWETVSLSPFEALVSRRNLKIDQIPSGWRIGTSSRRRREQLQKIRPDLAVVDVRGDIGERIALIEAGRVDALIVAHVALIRLGWEEKISQVFPLQIFPAHPKQGKLSILTREQECLRVRSILSAQARETGS